MYISKLLYFFPVQNSAKQFLIETKDDADAMNSDEFGYGNQKKDEDAFIFKQMSKNRKTGGGNRSPPNGCFAKIKEEKAKGICCSCIGPGNEELSCIPCGWF